MIRTLFKREFLSSFLGRKGGKRWTSLLSTLFFSALFVALVVFVYLRLFQQLSAYSGFNRSFLDFVFFFVFLLGIVFALPTMHKSFFQDEKERIILGSQPIPLYAIFVSKSLVSWCRNTFFLLLTYVPLGCTYGALSQAPFSFFLLLVLFLPFLSLLLTGVGFTFLVPYHAAYLFLRRHPLLAFLLTIGLSFLLAYLYSLFLSLFVDLIQNSSLDLLFTTERMQGMTAVAGHLYPTSFLSALMLLESGLDVLFFLLVLFFFLGVGSLLVLPSLKRHYLLSSKGDVRRDYFALPVDLSSPIKALVKKELSLVLSRSDGFFSFLSLVAVEPFLVYLVVSAINVIFRTGNFVFIETLFPNLLLLIDNVLILLFLSIINATSSMSPGKEGRNVVTMKTIPVPVKKQLLIKILVPFLFSFASYLISLVVLVSTGEITPWSFFFLLLIGTLFLATLSLSTLRLDLRRKKSDVLVLLVDFLLPVLFALLAFGATFLPALREQAVFSFYGTLLVLLLFPFLALLATFLTQADRLFLRFEGGLQP